MGSERKCALEMVITLEQAGCQNRKPCKLLIALLLLRQ
jgi:hypothetical protein